MRELDTTYESWSKKKIIAGIIIILLLIGTGYYIKDFLLKNNTIGTIIKNAFVTTNVAGVSTKKESPKEKSNSNTSLPGNKIKEEMQKKLDSIKDDVNNLSIADLASSSPQFKKVIQDIQNLQNLPRNQAKDACYNICRGL